MEKFEEIACKQCQLLLRENGILKRGRDVQRLKIREQAEELQKLEEQLQEEVNFSNSISELLKTNGEK